MRTNVELDDELMAETGRFARTKQKRAIVREALTLYVATKRDELRRSTYRERLQSVRTEVAKRRIDVDSHELVRRDRERR